MKQITSFLKWVFDIIFIIPFAILIMFYLKWFRLSPWVFSNDYPTNAFAIGLILLVIHAILVKAIIINKKSTFTKGILFSISILVFGLNYSYLDAHIPRLYETAKCNGVRYFLSYYSPLGDEQVQYDQLSQWDSIFYKSFTFKYVGSSNFRIICDEEKKVANFVNTYTQALYYTAGQNSRYYDDYVGTRLRGHRYFISREFSNRLGVSSNVTYTLYECKLDYTSCDPLKLQYAGDIEADSFILKADRSTNEINLIRQKPNGRKILVFTYGDNPRCYVEGCSIVDQ